MDNIELLSLKPELSPSPSKGKVDELPQREEIVTDLSLLPDGVSDKVESEMEVMRSTDLPGPVAEPRNEFLAVDKERIGGKSY